MFCFSAPLKINDSPQKGKELERGGVGGGGGGFTPLTEVASRVTPRQS